MWMWHLGTCLWWPWECRGNDWTQSWMFFPTKQPSVRSTLWRAVAQAAPLSFPGQPAGRCCSSSHKQWPRRQIPGTTAPAQSHTELQSSHPGALARIAAPGSGGLWSCTARLCSVIHYSEVLNNSAHRINSICH